MESLVTWIGGKGKMLEQLLPLFPKDCTGYIDPFVGGGSVYLAADGFSRYRVNDICPQLMALYDAAAKADSVFMNHLKDINAAWWYSGEVFELFEDDIEILYARFRPPVKHYLEFVEALNKELRNIAYDRVFPKRYTDDDAFEMEKRFRFGQLKSKLDRAPLKGEGAMEVQLMTAMKQSMYSYFTELYNGMVTDETLKRAILCFLLSFSTNGQFIFNKEGEYRPTYAGKLHNFNSMDRKIALLESEAFKERMALTKYYCEDAMAFIRRIKPRSCDFVFLDPPLGKMFKRVGNHTYSPEEFNALKRWMAGAKAKWLLTVPKGNLEDVGELADGKELRPLGVHGEFVAIMNYAV